MTADRPAPALSDEQRCAVWYLSGDSLDEAFQLGVTAGLAEGIRRERERCAKVCDDEAKNWTKMARDPHHDQGSTIRYAGAATGCNDCAAAIRAGSEGEK